MKFIRIEATRLNGKELKKSEEFIIPYSSISLEVENEGIFIKSSSSVRLHTKTHISSFSKRKEFEAKILQNINIYVIQDGVNRFKTPKLYKVNPLDIYYIRQNQNGEIEMIVDENIKQQGFSTLSLIVANSLDQIECAILTGLPIPIDQIGCTLPPDETSTKIPEYLPTPMIAIRKKELGDFELNPNVTIDLRRDEEGVFHGNPLFTDAYGNSFAFNMSDSGDGLTYMCPFNGIDNSNGVFFVDYVNNKYYWSIDTDFNNAIEIQSFTRGTGYEFKLTLVDLSLRFTNKFLNKLPEEGANLMKYFNSLSKRKNTYYDIIGFPFPDNYYAEYLDVYFNSFGDRDWLQLPDLKVELLTVSSNNYKKKSGISTNTSTLLISKLGNKDNFVTALTHPANNSVGNETTTGTIYSGGNGGSLATDTNPANENTFVKSEYKLTPDNSTFTNEPTIQSSSGKNRLNNPNIVFRIDIKQFIKRADLLNSGIQYPVTFAHNDEGLDAKVKIKNLKNKIKYNQDRKKVYKRNLILYFRLSAGVKGTGTINIENGGKEVNFKKRIFSDLSLPVFICPKIDRFSTKISYNASDVYYVMFGHNITLGAKI